MRSNTAKSISKFVSKAKELSRQLEALTRAMDETRGRLELLHESLNSKFNIKTLAEAKTLLDRLESEHAKIQPRLEKGIAEYEQKFGTLDAEDV